MHNLMHKRISNLTFPPYNTPHIMSFLTKALGGLKRREFLKPGHGWLVALPLN